MVERIALIVVLAEDLRQANLAYHYLIRCGHHWRNIRVLRAPQGRGSGEQYVRERYPIEVAEYRKSSKSRKAALLVAIDADTGPVEDRERQLHDALIHAGEAKRAQPEAIGVIIPKRNVETWVLCLSGRIVDETSDYKQSVEVDKLVKAAGAVLYDWSRTGALIPDTCVPSLRKGLAEVRRVG